MSLLPARFQFADPPFALGEKVQPKKAEPAPCPYAAFERTAHSLPEAKKRSWEEEKAHIYDDCSDAVNAFILKLRGGCGCSWPNAAPPCNRCTDPFDDAEVEQYMEEVLGMERPAVKKSLTPDPDGWIPHDGGPCPVDKNAAVIVRGTSGRCRSFSCADALGPVWACVTAYKLATPPEAPKAHNTDPEGPGTPAWKLKIQQQRQREGLPVEWDKVPVGSKVWVRDRPMQSWQIAEWHSLDEHASVVPYPYRAENDESSLWAQCKLHIEGVAP